MTDISNLNLSIAENVSGFISLSIKVGETLLLYKWDSDFISLKIKGGNPCGYMSETVSSFIYMKLSISRSGFISLLS